MGLLNSDGTGDTATLVFAGSVGSCQTVMMANAAHTGDSGLLLQLDKPTAFAGSVDLTQGTIDLVGLANADSYSFKNDILSVYSGNKVIDTLRLTNETQYGFAVEKVAGGVNIVALSSATNPSTGLPTHV
jgi:hypothetical protein